MNKKTFSGSICVDYKNITFNVCKIDYSISENESFEYVFTPNYFVINLLPSSIFQGIPGLNLEERKEKYVRKNIIPTFISERVPQKNREDFYQLLEELGMDYLNPIEYLLKTKRRYSGDSFYLKEYNAPETINVNAIQGKHNMFGIIKKLLDNIAIGNDVIYESTIINNTNRQMFFDVLFGLYKKNINSNKESMRKGIEKAKQQNKYKGRKSIPVDMILFEDQLNRINRGEITVKQACKKLGISIDKFYRVKKQKK